jgi:cytochrome P450
MGVAPPPPVPAGVVRRVASDLRAQRRARGQFPPGELGFSMRRTLAFERQPLPVLLRCRKRFGPVFTIRLLYAPVVFAIGPAANHYITVSHASNFRWRDGSLGDLIPLLGDGLLTTDGDYHKRARRIMLPAFHRERIAAAAGTMLEEAERALEPWRPGARVPLYTWTRQLALRIAMRALFGFDPDRIDFDMADEFERALGFWGRDYTTQMLRGPGTPWRQMLDARARLDRVIFAEIERRRESGERGEDILSLLMDASDEDGSTLSRQELRDQVMTLLFAGHDTTTSTVAFLFYELARNPHEQEPLRAELAGPSDGGALPAHMWDGPTPAGTELVDGGAPGGTEISHRGAPAATEISHGGTPGATPLSHSRTPAATEISHRGAPAGTEPSQGRAPGATPLSQGGAPAATPLSHGRPPGATPLSHGRAPGATPLVSGLPRLEMAIDETLRKYPPAWIGPRRSVEPFELEGIRVPGGVMVNYCSWASHWLPEVFPEPERFRPERFTPEARAALPKGAYVPFGGGSRTCIGMRFGLLEVKAIASSILRRFSLELAEPERPLSIRQMPTLSPRGGLPMVVRPAG